MRRLLATFICIYSFPLFASEKPTIVVLGNGLSGQRFVNKALSTFGSANIPVNIEQVAYSAYQGGLAYNPAAQNPQSSLVFSIGYIEYTHDPKFASYARSRLPDDHPNKDGVHPPREWVYDFLKEKEAKNRDQYGARVGHNFTLDTARDLAREGDKLILSLDGKPDIQGNFVVLAPGMEMVNNKGAFEKIGDTVRIYKPTTPVGRGFIEHIPNDAPVGIKGSAHTALEVVNQVINDGRSAPITLYVRSGELPVPFAHDVDYKFLDGAVVEGRNKLKQEKDVYIPLFHEDPAKVFEGFEQDYLTRVNRKNGNRTEAKIYALKLSTQMSRLVGKDLPDSAFPEFIGKVSLLDRKMPAADVTLYKNFQRALGKGDVIMKPMEGSEAEYRSLPYQIESLDVEMDYSKVNGMWGNMISNGIATPDPRAGLGVWVTDNLELRSSNGHVSENIFVSGAPLIGYRRTRGMIGVAPASIGSSIIDTNKILGAIKTRILARIF